MHFLIIGTCYIWCSCFITSWQCLFGHHNKWETGEIDLKSKHYVKCKKCRNPRESRHLNIAQIGPLSFQEAIEHKPRQVRWGGLHTPVVTEWWPACLHKQFPSVHHRGNLRKPQMKDVHNFITFGPTNPMQILNQHELFFEDFVCVLEMILLIKIKNLEVGTGAQQQRQEVY